MVGKLNDMVTAAVVVDTASKSSSVQNLNTASQIKPLDAGTQQSVFKTQDSALFQKSEEEKKEQEGRLEPGTMSEESVSNMTEVFNELMDKINCNLQFNYNREADMLNVKMIDKQTKEVIKEFPPEEMIENMIKAKDWLGAFIDKAI